MIELNKVHISFSELSEYLGCSFKHYLGYTKKLKKDSDSIHLTFGKIIHSTIEKFLKKELTRNQAVMYFVSSLINTDTMKKYRLAELEKFKTQGLKILFELFNKYSWDKIVIIENEFSLYEPIFGNFYFKGFIDFIYKYGNYIYIADFKTTTKEWNHFKLEDKYYGLQLKLYKYFYAKKFNIPLDNIKLVYIVLNRNDDNEKLKSLIDVKNVPSSASDIKKAYSLLIEALNTIYGNSNGNYLRQTIGFNCNICEFNGTEHCGGNIKTRFYRQIIKKEVS